MRRRARWFGLTLLCGIAGCATVQSVDLERGRFARADARPLVGTATRLIPIAGDSVIVEVAVAELDNDSTVVACYASDLSADDLGVIARLFPDFGLERTADRIRESREPLVPQTTPRGRQVIELRLPRERVVALPSQSLVVGLSVAPRGSVDGCPRDDTVQLVDFGLQEERQGPYMVLGVGMAFLAILLTGALW